MLGAILPCISWSSPGHAWGWWYNSMICHWPESNKATVSFPLRIALFGCKTDCLIRQYIHLKTDRSLPQLLPLPRKPHLCTLSTNVKIQWSIYSAGLRPSWDPQAHALWGSLSHPILPLSLLMQPYHLCGRVKRHFWWSMWLVPLKNTSVSFLHDCPRLVQRLSELGEPLGLCLLGLMGTLDWNCPYAS